MITEILPPPADDDTFEDHAAHIPMCACPLIQAFVDVAGARLVRTEWSALLEALKPFLRAHVPDPETDAAKLARILVWCVQESAPRALDRLAVAGNDGEVKAYVQAATTLRTLDPASAGSLAEAQDVLDLTRRYNANLQEEHDAICNALEALWVVQELGEPRPIFDGFDDVDVAILTAHSVSPTDADAVYPLAMLLAELLAIEVPSAVA
jgi:hypothetical protein